MIKEFDSIIETHERSFILLLTSHSNRLNEISETVKSKCFPLAFTIKYEETY